MRPLWKVARRDRRESGKQQPGEPKMIVSAGSLGVSLQATHTSWAHHSATTLNSRHFESERELRSTHKHTDLLIQPNPESLKLVLEDPLVGQGLHRI